MSSRIAARTRWLLAATAIVALIAFGSIYAVSWATADSEPPAPSADEVLAKIRFYYASRGHVIPEQIDVSAAQLVTTKVIQGRLAALFQGTDSMGNAKLGLLLFEANPEPTRLCRERVCDDGAGILHLPDAAPYDDLAVWQEGPSGDG